MSWSRIGSTLPLALIAVAAVAIVRSLTPYGAATSPDSLCYLEAASNFREGRGLILGDTRLDATLPYKPLTTWPPLYPLALACLGVEGTPLVTTAAFLSMALLALSGWLLYAIVRPAAGLAGAMIAVLVFFVAPATLSFFTYAWSEALFVPLLLAAIWLAVCLASPPSARVDPDAANRPVPSRSHPIHAVLLAATLMALVYTRYAGIAFAILLPLGWWLSPDRRRLFRSFFLASLGYAAGVGILLARNYAVARSLTGESRAASRHGIAANLADLIRCLIPPCPDALLTTVAGASLALLAVGMRLLPLKSSGLNPALSQSRDASIRMGLSLAAAAGYLSYLVLLRSLKQFDRIDIRLTGVVLPLLIVALAVAARRAWDRRRRVRIVDLSALALAAAVAGVELRQGWLIYRRALSDWELRWSPSMPAGPNLVYTNHTLPPGQNYFKAVTGRLAPLRGGVIVTDRPDPVHFHTDLPVRQFPESSLTPELIRTINAVGGKGCVLLQRADMIGRLTGLYRERGRTLDLDADAMRQYGILLVPLPLPDVTAPP